MPQDDYKTKYMGGGQALPRTRAGMPWWFHLLPGVAAAVLLGSALSHGALAPLAMLPLLALTWLLFMFLRVTVTPELVHVQLAAPAAPRGLRVARVESGHPDEGDPLEAPPESERATRSRRA